MQTSQTSLICHETYGFDLRSNGKAPNPGGRLAS